ncbi:helix-turn-helix domain-containing protein [Ramlibacter sp.]|uniref:helix-turn-helix domain-containing protein n=1 Tax=Ramlibacter sp. TaxID=1917967 RepID=UPI003D1228BE
MKSAVAPPPPPILVERIAALGARIRSARQHRQLRQIDLAERTGLSRSTIEAIEKGSFETGIGAYARALWVMGLDGEST